MLANKQHKSNTASKASTRTLRFKPLKDNRVAVTSDIVSSNKKKKLDTASNYYVYSFTRNKDVMPEGSKYKQVWHLSASKVIGGYGIVQQWKRNIYLENKYSVVKFFQNMDHELSINLSNEMISKLFLKNSKAKKNAKGIAGYEFYA